MDDRDPPGYDDWFDEPEPPTLERGRGGRPSYDIPGDTEEDVWVLPEDKPRLPRRGGRRGDGALGGRSLTTTQVAIIAIVGLVVILAIVAAAGGFSSTPAPSTLTITNQTTHHTTTTTPTTPTVALPTKTPLQQGDTGPQVKLLQKALNAAGFPPGGVDGSYGPGTTSAVQNFQNAYGLDADGVFGAKTLAALKHALAR